MDLERLSNEDKLALCKKYFFMGFALLPFMWAVNAVWFLREAFLKPPFAEQRTLRNYVVASGCGAAAWLAAVVAWVWVFTTHRLAWGELGDDLSFVIPKGVP